MQTIPIATAEADMVLARDVRSPANPDGPPLCGAGVVLTQAMITRLRNLGITTLSVKKGSPLMEEDTRLDERLAALDRRFKRVAHDPLMLVLKEIHRSRILRDMGEADGR